MDEFHKIINFLMLEQNLHFDGQYHGESNFSDSKFKYQLISPHSGTDYKYMIRKAEKYNFDRWANSEEGSIFFENSEEIKKRYGEWS